MHIIESPLLAYNTDYLCNLNGYFMTTISESSFVVAITGGIACGKSEVKKIFLENGFTFFDADKRSHLYLGKKYSTYKKIINKFGISILNEDKTISKRKLAERIFKNNEERNFLNNLIHPLIEKDIKNWINYCRINGLWGVAEIPLMYECNLDKLSWDKIIIVHAKKNIVIGRLIKRDLTKNEAILRINAQMNINDKCNKSDILIDGNKNPSFLNQSVINLINNWSHERK